MTAAAPLLVIAAGGTGGHMFPAQALAEAMLRKGWRVHLSTDSRGARYTGGFPATVKVSETSSATFARGSYVARATVPFRIVKGVLSTLLQFQRDPPEVVVGFGGYPTIPAMGAAVLLDLPRMLHEQNGVLGRVNQRFARRVHLVACGTWPTELPSGVKSQPTGNPVRAAVRALAGAPYTAPGPDGPLNLLVMGGSQGARILSDVVPEALGRLPEDLRGRLQVSHQAREEDRLRVEGVYSMNGITADVQTFFTDAPRRIAEAQLVITRSGASTIADLSVIGRPSVLVPLAAAIRDEQTANARGLVEADAAILIPESRLDPATLAENVAAVLTNPEAASQMAATALSTGRPEATDTLTALVEQMAHEARDH